MFESPAALVWETCLRSIAFNSNAYDLVEADEVYRETGAYRFLLEVICGLHSPVVGETEVFGQFKSFTKVWLEREPGRASLVQRLFSEAKEIRSEYLLNLGTQSYGSWLKRKITGKQIHILGGGNLAKDISPYLLKIADSVVVHARQPEKLNIGGVEVRPLSACRFDGGCLIVAAPMTALEIQNWLLRSPSEIFDLRDSSSADPLLINCKNRHVLGDIFGEIERTKARLQPIVEAVKSDILARSERMARQVHVRPQGWDDICA
jgi:glutamyl-tRNA reductase